MRAMVTGATGFVGRRLLESLDQPVVLTRNPAEAQRRLPGVKVFAWDPEKGPPPPEAFRDVDTVFHLAGEPVAEGRWNPAKKRRIRESRELGTRNLVAGIGRLEQKPRVLVSASAVGYYGSRGDETLDEQSRPADDFLAKVCIAWETESHPARAMGVRVVNPRIGLVLGPGGGALAKMLFPFKLGLGGPLGSGKQWMAWIHVDDLVGLMLFAAENASMEGPANATAPQPVTNAEFTRVLARELHRPAFLPAPAFALRLALGEFAEVLLASQRVLPRVAEAAGYRFRYPQLAEALRASIGSSIDDAK